MASGSQSSGVNRIWSLECIYNKVSKLQANFYTFLQILQGMFTCLPNSYYNI
jgi:hypothetical protein